ncbi:Holliday junction branch migration protein RuvA [Edaphobacillus lindanitolerans]|uniref:Holliday junction branch migration complex subunit RuvA n=1 Tax=Edaphobacillus lindanitolerans TaxID=550447 RepID=A0A1U7PPP2_9BACI|nr:Holliday junction branch migration protein RuvA [Edaphobacillus lindanitolerans]SIT82961.1 Holliday junction DNA helicase subunit RuvA [Edaphobacillus lindanitolerans]
MYDYIKGQITRVTPEYITVEQGGIGYQIMTPNPYAFHAGSGEQQIFTHLHVREDVMQLLGFRTAEDRELFRKLITVTGVGPKGALAILAGGMTAQVVSAIESEDEKFLVKFPGVGKKTARQIILDLKGKLEGVAEGPSLFRPDAPEPGIGANQDLEEAMLALAALGYSERELAKIRARLEQEEHNTEGYMKRALALLLKQG